MRLAILADIHANLPALEMALRDLRSQRCDKLVSLGDAVGIGPYPSETLELLFSENVAGIMGNHEEYLLGGFPTPRSGKNSAEEIEHQRWTRDQVSSTLKEWVRGWPYDERTYHQSASVRLLHFAYDQEGITPLSITADCDLELLFGRNEAFTIFGHTHKELDVTGRARYVNPGALGCSRDDHARYLIVDTSGTEMQIERRSVRFGRKALLDEFESRKVPAREEIFRIFYGV
jgi:predicted phosphodiesterase